MVVEGEHLSDERDGENDARYLETLEKFDRDLQGYHDFMVQTFVKRPYLKLIDRFYGIHEQTSINAKILQEMTGNVEQLQLVVDRVDHFLSGLNPRHRLVAILYFHLRTGVDKMSGEEIRKKLQPLVSKQRISAMVKTIKRLLSNDTIENGSICGLQWYDPKK